MDVAFSALSPETRSAAWYRVARAKERGTKWWFSLRGAEALLAGLRFDRLFRTDATADAAGQRWTFHHVGWVRKRFRVDRDQRPIGAFEKTGPARGTLTLDDAAFGWWHTSPAQAEYGWFDGDRLLLTMWPCATGPALAEVRLVEPGHAHAPLLLAFGLYLFVLAENDTSVVRLRIP